MSLPKLPHETGYRAFDFLATSGHLPEMALPRNARAVAQALRADVRQVPGGHQLMAEQPDAVLAALRQFIG